MRVGGLAVVRLEGGDVSVAEYESLCLAPAVCFCQSSNFNRGLRRGSWTKTEPGGNRTFNTEQRRIAIGTFVKFDHSYADTVSKLGHPMTATLRKRWKAYRQTGEVPAGKLEGDPKCADETRRAAVDHYLGHGRGLARTTRALGCPKSRGILCGWIDGMAPGERRHRGPDPKKEAVPIEQEVQVVAELEARGGTAAEVSGRRGASRTGPYVWRREMPGDSGGNPERRCAPVGKGYDDPPDDVGQPQDILRETKMRLGKVRLGLDVRQATLEMVKKTRAPTRAG